jgi:hypothetical protein
MTTEIDRSNSLADLAARIKAEHEATSDALKGAVAHAMAAGDLLIEAKAQVPHGQWLPWLRDHCNVSERMAQRYIRLARNRTTIEMRHSMSDSSIGGALALLTIPKDSSDLDEHFATLAVESLLDTQDVNDLNLAIAEREKRKPLWGEALAALDRAQELDRGHDPVSTEAFISEYENVCAIATAAILGDRHVEATEHAAKIRDLANDWLHVLEKAAA